jgi:hypothetical protein
VKASAHNILINEEYCDLPEPVIPNIIPYQRPLVSLLVSQEASTFRTLSGQTHEDSNLCNSRVVLNEADHSGLSLLFGDGLDLDFGLLPNIQPQLSQAQSSDSMHRPSMPSLSPSSVNGETVNSTPSTNYSLTSKPSTLSVSSLGTFKSQNPELSVNRPHLFSFPPTPPSNITQLVPLSITALASGTQKDSRSRPQAMSFAERYANVADYSGHSGHSGQESGQYRPWRPYKSKDVYELQGSENI